MANASHKSISFHATSSHISPTLRTYSVTKMNTRGSEPDTSELSDQIR